MPSLEFNSSCNFLNAIKHKLLNLCHDYVDQRINTARQAIEAAQSAANEETKSSSGDKYETGRSMMQLEIEKNTVQLAEAMNLKKKLELIKPDNQSSKIRLGSLVRTNQGNFFIAISVGHLVVEDNAYIVVSAESPMGIKLLGLQTGTTFAFGNKTFLVEQVW